MPARVDAARFFQPVFEVHLPEIEDDHGRWQSCIVGIPIEEIEGHGFSAHEVVVHKEGPDEIVLAHHREHLGHVPAFEIAFLGDMPLELGDLGVIDEDRRLADILEVEQRGEEGRSAQRDRRRPWP